MKIVDLAHAMNVGLPLPAASVPTADPDQCSRCGKVGLS